MVWALPEKFWAFCPPPPIGRGMAGRAPGFRPASAIFLAEKFERLGWKDVTSPSPSGWARLLLWCAPARSALFNPSAGIPAARPGRRDGDWDHPGNKLDAIGVTQAPTAATAALEIRRDLLKTVLRPFLPTPPPRPPPSAIRELPEAYPQGTTKTPVLPPSPGYCDGPGLDGPTKKLRGQCHREWRGAG